MDYEKLIDLVDNYHYGDYEISKGSELQQTYDRMRIEVFKRYANDFIVDINTECMQNGWIDAPITDFMYLTKRDEKSKISSVKFIIKVAHHQEYALVFNILKLKDMIELFESHKDEIKAKTLHYAKIVFENRPKYFGMMTKLLLELQKFDFVGPKPEIYIESSKFDFNETCMRYTIAVKDPAFKMELTVPFYKGYDEYMSSSYDKLVKNTYDVMKHEFAKNIRNRYGKELQDYNKQMTNYKYNPHGNMVIVQPKGLKQPKLSLNEKYFLINYAEEMHDYNLIQMLNSHRSHLPKALKDRLDKMLVMEKLKNA